MVVNLRDLVMSHEKIYSLLYSPYRVESDPLEKQITEISTESLRWSDDGTTFVYVWGWPGIAGMSNAVSGLQQYMEGAF